MEGKNTKDYIKHLEDIKELSYLEIDKQKAKIEALQKDKQFFSEQWERTSKENTKIKEAMQWFVDRCEKGEVRSKRTYARFKELLNKQ